MLLSEKKGSSAQIFQRNHLLLSSLIVPETAMLTSYKWYKSSSSNGAEKYEGRGKNWGFKIKRKLYTYKYVDLSYLFKEVPQRKLHNRMFEFKVRCS